MKKNIFEETYNKVQEAKRAYNEAKNEEEQNAAKALYKKAKENLNGLSRTELRIWSAYETARDCGNEYLDINDTVSDEAVESLIACMRSYGIKAFTFSSTWSSAVETAWLFQKAGCILKGFIEINSHCKDFMSDEYEKAHGYLFEIR